MVSGFQDDLDSDDEIPTNPLAMAAVPSKDVTLSSEEEQEGSGPLVTRDLDSEPDTEG